MPPKRSQAKEAVQRPQDKEVEMADTTAPKEKKSRKTKARDPPVTAIPEGAVTEGVANQTMPIELVPPDLDTPERQDSAIRFCPVCRYYLYTDVTGSDQSLFHLCRNCGYRKEDEKGGLVMEMMVQERAAEGYKILLNEFTRRDPRLPHIKKDIKCPDPACESNHGSKDPDVIYIKYDAVNMLYLYICDVCGYQWRSRR